jgi:Family of unknown function (DUF6512)
MQSDANSLSEGSSTIGGVHADLLPWTLVSIPAIILAGTFLHFAYGWSGRRRIVAVFTPVNESVWEHLKMAYWPLMLYICVAFTLRDPPASLLSATALGFLVTAALMFGLFYLSVRAAPDPANKGRLIADGIIFVIAVAAGQLLSYVLVGRVNLDTTIGLALLLAPAIALAFLTFAPPRLPLFRDQLNGTYGVPPSAA